MSCIPHNICQLFCFAAAAAFRLVELPLNGQQQQQQPAVPSDPLEAAAAAAQLSREDVQLLMSQVSWQLVTLFTRVLLVSHEALYVSPAETRWLFRLCTANTHLQWP
jgi:hypothetical protein